MNAIIRRATLAAQRSSRRSSRKPTRSRRAALRLSVASVAVVAGSVLLPGTAAATGNSCTYIGIFTARTCITVTGTGNYVQTVQASFAGIPAGVSETGRFYIWGPHNYQHYTGSITSGELGATVSSSPVKIDRQLGPGPIYAQWQEKTGTGFQTEKEATAAGDGPVELVIHPAPGTTSGPYSMCVAKSNRQDVHCLTSNIPSTKPKVATFASSAGGQFDFTTAGLNGKTTSNGGTEYIKDAHDTNECLQLDHADGNVVVWASCNNGAAEQWDSFLYKGGSYQLQSVWLEDDNSPSASDCLAFDAAENELKADPCDTSTTTPNWYQGFYPTN